MDECGWFVAILEKEGGNFSVSGQEFFADVKNLFDDGHIRENHPFFF